MQWNISVKVSSDKLGTVLEALHSIGVADLRLDPVAPPALPAPKAATGRVMGPPIAKAIREMLAEQPLTGKEITARLGVSSKKAHGSLSHLRKVDHVRKLADGTYKLKAAANG